MLGTAFFALMALLALSIPVAAALFGLSFLLDYLYAPGPLYKMLGNQLWESNTNFILVSVPLFILLGEVLLRAGIANKVYETLQAWTSWMPGGLLHANIGTATLFSATCGSSVATAATVGTIAMPQARRLGYHEGLFAGSIAAGGTLGILIPPSINLIIYGFLSQTSIPKLFMAGIIPGLALAIVFSITIVILCLIKPALGGPKYSAEWSVRLALLRHLLPVLALFGFIMGSIYTGWATPTEAAAIGVVISLIMAAAAGKLNWPMLRECLDSTMRTTCMLMLIIVCAHFLNYVLSSIGLTNQLMEWVASMNLSPLQTIYLLVLIYLVLGLFIETLSLMMVTIPLVAPLVISLGFDPVWFGILLIVLIEMALITPPVGMNLYVVQGVRGRGNLSEVIYGCIPFVISMLVMVFLLITFPDIALYLPNLLSN